MKLGETCITYFFVIGTATFVLPNINGGNVSDSTMCVCIVIMFVLFVSAIFLLHDGKEKALPGKWKRIKVKKDTTIHIEEEQQ